MTVEKKRIRWKRRFRRDAIVWISVQKLDNSWKEDRTYYVGPGVSGPGNGKLYKYDRFGEWLEQRKTVWMPHIALSRAGYVSFSDGRHRFAWFRDHGVRFLPVTVSPEELGIVRKRFGTRSRASYLRISKKTTPLTTSSESE